MKNVLIIDSGAGAISIAKEIQKQCSANLIVYVANGEAPLGEKSKEELEQIANNIIRRALNACKIDLIVLACNTLTVATIDLLRATCSIPIVGTEPNVKISETPALILCTTFTCSHCKIIKSSKFDKIALRKLATLIDKNLLNLRALSGYFKPLVNTIKRKNYKAISLGCTHYAYIESILKEVMQKSGISGNVKIYQNKFGVANRVKCVLEELDRISNNTQSHSCKLKRKRKNSPHKCSYKLVLSKKDVQLKKIFKCLLKT